MNYTYDPAKIGEDTADRMRFELGDVEISQGGDSAALADEEYAAIIKRAKETDGRGWKWAKLLCLQAIMMRFSLETDFASGGATISLSQRYERWRGLYLMMQKSFQVPTAACGALDGDHYFNLGMHRNVQASGSPFGVPDRPQGAGRL